MGCRGSGVRGLARWLQAVCLVVGVVGLVFFSAAASAKQPDRRPQRYVRRRSARRPRARPHTAAPAHGPGARSARRKALAAAAPAVAQPAPSAGVGSSLAGSPLVVPAAEALVGGQLGAAAEAAKLASPEAVAAREASRTAYEGLSGKAAERLADEAFPSVIDEAAGGLPKLPAGESIVGYPSDDAAQVDLPGGKHGVIESTVPLAVETSPGRKTPVDLALGEAGGAFGPRTSAVGVRIPKRLADGVSLASSGISLTPVGARGAALGGSEGRLDGAAVFYADTQTDADTVIKPTVLGFEAYTLLRSADSPRQLSFRVGLPAGASLVREKGGLGAVRVVDDGAVLALVLPPDARDAAGTSVPVSIGVSGDMLSLSVGDRAGQYMYPISVDPTVVDDETSPGNWTFITDNKTQGLCWKSGSGWLGVGGCVSENGGFERGQYGDLLYTTKGESKIDKFRAETQMYGATGYVASYMAIANSSYEAGPVELPRTQQWNEVSVASPSNGNTALYEVIATKSASKEVAEYVESLMHHTEVTIQQENGPHASMNTTSEIVDGEQNALYGSRWASITSASAKWGFEFNATDPGLGIDHATWSSPNASKWGGGGRGAGKACKGVECEESASVMQPLKVELGEQLPEGEDTVEAKVEDPVGLSASTGAYKVKVDNAPPHNITISGLANGGEIEGGSTNVKVEATDGEGTTPSSGVKSIAVSVDGREIEPANGSCSVPTGSCTAKGEWTVSGGEFGAGEHKLKVTATDNALNVATDEITLKVHHATPVSVGPGAVAPTSGEFSMSSTDVSVGAPGSSLTVGRSYQSRSPMAGAEGPLGPQWSLSVGGQESITKLPTGSATLTASSGVQTAFASKEGGGFSSPTGDANLTLSEGKNAKGELTEYVLKDAGDAETTRFTSLGGPSSSLWKPTKQEGPIASQAVRYIYQTAEGITEPKYGVAPEPGGLSVSCISALEKSEPLEKLEKGCRVLEFQYGTSTKATGENESEWNEYKGRLKQVLFEAESSSSKKMEAPVAVAAYIYDKQGRLRAEWNPQLEHSLKVVYGYDPEGHVTAMTPPGQESWAFTYGTMAGDSNAGRLLKVMRAPASAKLWGGEAPKNTEAPRLTGTPMVGVRMSASIGTWSNEPVAYGYQWEDCNSEGKACAIISGADNANYTIASSDVGHTLVAQVTATNGGGTVIASSASSTEVKARITEYPVGEAYFGVAAGSDGNLWLTQEEGDAVSKVTPTGGVTTYKLPSPFCGPNYITAGPEKEGALWFTDVCGAAIGKITTAGSTTAYSVPSGSTLRGITAGPDGNLWFAAEGSGKIGKITTSGTITEYSLPKGSDPYGITPGPSKESALWFTDRGTSKIGKITTSGTVTEYSLASGSEPAGITVGSDGNLWFAEEGTNKIGKMTTSGTKTEYPVSGGSPLNITSGSDGNLWFTVGSNKIERMTTSGTIGEYTLPAESGPAGITAGPNSALWFTETGVGKFGELPVESEGEVLPAQPGTTIEYNVPVSGTGLSTSLTKAEAEKWGQKNDDPTEGMAIFPPAKPQAWPASSYESADNLLCRRKGKGGQHCFPKRWGIHDRIQRLQRRCADA